MMHVRTKAALVGAVCLSVLASVMPAAHAEGGEGWFVPKASQPAVPPQHAATHRAAPPPVALPAPPADSQEADQAPPVLPQPNIPDAPEIAKEAPPPTTVIGVISVGGVMRQSTAAMQVEHILGARRDALAQDLQKEQAAWRDEQQSLQAQAKSLSSDQIQSRERALQARVMKAQRDFRNRNRIIQEAAQVSLGQIERELVQVIQKVASAHGMNLVLHSEQVALHVDGQDITNEVAVNLNKILPSVFIPAANEDPEQLAKSGKMPTTADTTQSVVRTGPAPVVQPTAGTP
ncbi:OmpH family outer membrane protein [Acetobacter suratthaniensis]|uniref:OmpH family outer membrane protein n=1 Tax=Acetobacter suratthaniensis TaxID=1502841 RepID=A0ABS3LHB5_9PROT|nr:OmpH family outer membrane protein [Acetobacter suratthaniensis]MBO1326981.1 OmpH family outer membrane protein [Acetobacter suratthaniensis]MCX2565409.1 OmpH family outer membrane protein [Acetobacter suratthaniensis]